MRICFYMPRICVRGSSVATYDYMRFNEELLKNESVLVLPKDAFEKNDPLGVKRFSRFRIVYINENLDSTLTEEKCDLLYCIKYGKNDGIFSKKFPTAIHCVFDLSEPHGDIYAAVSESLARKYNSKLFVPHMIALTPSQGDLREQFDIPKDAVVFGRYGGEDTFNIPFCFEAIFELVQECSNIYFIFINTPHFIFGNRQVLFLPKIITEEDKSKFINTCDAHLECGTLGHSFGCAIGEFSVHNKPIIAYDPDKDKPLWNRAHLDILGDKAIRFRTKEDFKNIIKTFNPIEAQKKDWNCYRQYSPEKVMDQFKKVFIDPIKIQSLD